MRGRFCVFIRFIFFIISVIFVIHLWIILFGGGFMASFLSVPYQKGADNEGFSFSIETETEYKLGVDVVEYGQKEIAVKIFRVDEGINVVFLDKYISTYSKNKNRIVFPVNFKAGDYYFRSPDNKLKNIRLYQRKPTSRISKLFHYLDRNILLGFISPLTGGMSFFYLFYFIDYLLSHFIRRP